MVYVGNTVGQINLINIYTGATTLVGSVGFGFRIAGLAVHPKNGTLWMSLRNLAGTIDGIYKVDPNTAVATLVGKTGKGIGTADIIFNKNGKLFGLTGTTGTDINELIVIDTTNGFGYTINATPYSTLQALALNPDAVEGAIENNTKIPTQFSLEQNYPNPFNPLTSIQYSVPVGTHVELKVYDALGKELSTLADGFRQPGTYREYFDASRYASGIYYYKIIAGSFTETRKMVVLK
jgi:hypothetical protein